MNNNILKVENISKSFLIRNNFYSRKKIKAVNNISFNILNGESLGLIGESGCGKSTTANLIMKLLPLSSGKIEFMGLDITNYNQNEMQQHRKDLQIIFQYTQGPLDPKMTIEELLAEPLKIFKIVHDDEIDNEINKLLNLVGLDPIHKSKYPNQLSGGQNQRVNIARAISTKPKLIICDEPVSALDVSVQGQILNLLMDLKKELNLTFLFISHNLKVVQHICDRIAVMKDGEIVELNTTDNILLNPQHDYTTTLINSNL